MIGERLNKARKAKGLTAQQMAEKLGISIRTYRYYESDTNSPSFEILVPLSDILDISIDYLMGRDDFLKSHGVSFDGH